MDKEDIIVVGIAGASGSGKSLLAGGIIDQLGSDRVSVISEDAYYKDISHMPYEERCEVNFDHPDAFDHALLKEHLAQIKANQGIEMPVYDFTQHLRTAETVKIAANHSIIVLEGILLFTDPALRDLMDIRIYVDTPLDISFIRRLERDVIERGRAMESVVRQYYKTVRPMYIQFIEPSKRYADIIVPHGGKNRIAIDVIRTKLQALLTEGANFHGRD